MADNDMYRMIHSMNIMIGKTSTIHQTVFIYRHWVSKMDGRPPRTAEEIELLE